MVKKNRLFIKERSAYERIKIIEALILFSSLSFLFFKASVYFAQNPWTGALEIPWGILLFITSAFMGLSAGISLWAFGETIIAPLNSFLPYIFNKNSVKFFGIACSILLAILIFIKYSSDNMYFWVSYISFIIVLIKGDVKLIRW